MVTTLPSNGRLDEATLAPLANFAPIQSGALGLATPTVARQWGLMADHFEHDLDKLLYASEGYRNYERQVALKRAQEAGSGVLAAVPGTSNHGEAIAIDVGSGVGVQTGREYAWMAAHAAAYGFSNDVTSEGWHWHYDLTPTIITPLASILAAISPEGDTPVKLFLLKKKDGNQQFIVENRKGQFVGLKKVAWAEAIKKAYGVKAVEINESDFYAMTQIANGKNT